MQLSDYYNLGFSFTTLDGKKPTRHGWPTEPRLDLATLEAWSGNIGLRTGAASGVIVVDIDGDPGDLLLPETVEVRTGSGGRHLYYRADRPVRNRTRVGGRPVDIRGDGGQVVFPGSIHPDTGLAYEWVRDPLTYDIAEAPDWVYQAAPRERSNRYALAALEDECTRVRSAAPGCWNDTLNKAAYALGQFIPCGHLTEAQVRAALANASATRGHAGAEVEATIESGLKSGMQHPRELPVLSSDIILLPGVHTTDAGTHIEVSNSRFVEAVLRALPTGTLYRRDRLVGELLGEPGHRDWTPVETERMRIIIDTHLRLGMWRTGKDHEAHLLYDPCRRDPASLIRSAAAALVEPIRLIVQYPVYGPNMERVPAGYHAGIYYDEPSELADLSVVTDTEEIGHALHTLVEDFPFKSEADRQNFYGLLLTPIVAPAIAGNRPMHMIISPMERTGKSKLAEDVVGGIILGRTTPAMQLTDRDEERDKRILGLILKGETVIHMDNLPPHIDSGALSSILTASSYCGRLLGTNLLPNLNNYLVIIGSGNNVECSGEIIKRAVPIILQTRGPKPEERTDFAHPDLRGYVSGVRRHVLGCLLGMVENARPHLSSSVGRGYPRMGGFEDWARLIGTVMNCNGFGLWRTNESEWRRESNPVAADVEAFVAEWGVRYSTAEVGMQELLDVANRCNDTYITGHKNPLQVLGHRMRRLRDVPVGEWVVRRRHARNGQLYHLEPQKCEDV